MNILVATAFSAVGGTGGSPRVIRALVRELRARGHTVTLLQIYVDHDIFPGIYFTLEHYREMGFEVRPAEGGAATLDHDGVEVHLVPGFLAAHKLAELGAAQHYTLSLLKRVNPDCIIVNDMLSDYHAWLYGTLVEWNAGRVVNIIQTGSFFPFGPNLPCDPGLQIARTMHATKTVVAGKYVRDYLKQWAGLDATVTYFPMYGPPPFPKYGRFDDGFVTSTNTHFTKGGDLFVQLAARMPETDFAGITNWGHATVTKLPNLAQLRPVRNIDQIYSQTRVVVAPSLLPEAFPLAIVEAMLRGIPVIASNAGGSVEAKLGVPYVIPIARTGPPVWVWDDSSSRFVSTFPELEYRVEPFYEVLTKLLSDRDHYLAIAEESRDTAMQFVSGLSWDYVIETILAML